MGHAVENIRIPTERMVLSCVAMVLILLWLLGTGASSLICLLASANMAFFLFIVVVEKDYMAPPFFLFLNIFLGVLDIILVATGGREVASKYDSEIYAETLLISFAWLFCFYVGYKLANPKLDKVRQGGDSVDFLFTPLVVFLLLLFAYSLISAIRNSMSLGGLIEGMLGGGAAFEDQGYLMTMLSLCGMLPVIALSKEKIGLGLLCAIVIFAGIALTGRRSLAIFTAIVPVVIFWHYRVRPIQTRHILTLGFLILIFVLSIGAIRTSVEANATNDSGLAVLTKYIGYGRNTPDLVNAIESGSIQFQGFKYSFRGIEYFIPRSVWPDKPLVHSSDITSNILYFQGDVGRPTGPFGWAYFCFGPVGVCLCAAITGAVCKYFYCYCTTKRDVFSLSLYALLIMSMLDIFTPEAQMKIILFGIFTLIVKLLIRRQKSKNHRHNEIASMQQKWDGKRGRINPLKHVMKFDIRG